MTASAVDYRALYLAQRGRCFYCQGPMPPRPYDGSKARRGQPSQGWTKDHFRPRVGGNPLGQNVVLACEGCNNDKADRLPDSQERHRFAVMMRAYWGVLAQ